MIKNSLAVQAMFRAGASRAEVLARFPEFAGKRQLLDYHERAACAPRAPRRINGLLPRAIFDRLAAAAARRGVSPIDFVAKLVADYTPDPGL